MATTTNFAPGQSWTGSNPFAGTTAADRARNLVLARRHTRYVRALRWSLPVAAASVSVLYFVMILDTTGWVAGIPKLTIPRIIPDNLTMDNPRYEGFNKDGGTYVVTAKTALQDLVNTDHVRLNGINGDLLDAKKSKTNLKAVQGDFNTKSNELELSGGIDIVAESGLKAKLSRATIFTKDNVIVSKEPVLVEMPTGTVRSNEMRLHNKSREIAFIGSVDAHMVPNEAEPKAAPVAPAKQAVPLLGGGKGPIEVTSNRLDIDDTAKTAVFSGTVKAQQADAILETASLEILYAGGDPSTSALPGSGTKIQRIKSKTPVVMTRAPQDRVTGASLDYDAVNQVAVVSGNVQMASGTDRGATADEATVNQQADTILLTGSVVTKQGRNVLKGERLYVERATGRTQLTSPGPSKDEPGRISSRFYRNDPSSVESAKAKVKQLAQSAASTLTGTAGVFKTDPTAPIDIDATRLDVDDRTKQAVFRGDVHAVQGDFVVRTSELRSFYTGSAGLAEQTAATEQKSAAQLNRIEARGKVIVTSKNGQNATGDWADYDVKANQVVLGGDVVLTQGKNVVRGSKLTIDMVTGQSIIDSSGSGKGGPNDGEAWSATAAPGGGAPVQTVTGRPSTTSRPSAIFYPRDKKPAEKKPTEGATEAPGGGWSSDTSQ
jgi:lipopolysaccharide transport protein LptA/LPS export ABC transporter protein LptC